MVIPRSMDPSNLCASYRNAIFHPIKSQISCRIIFLYYYFEKANFLHIKIKAELTLPGLKHPFIPVSWSTKKNQPQVY